ncbi:MAG: hypothetical protein M0Z82_03940 [Actinomycetota bacterium]|nr:hypothetical protein [Actinomycetota bacterium]
MPSRSAVADRIVSSSPAVSASSRAGEGWEQVAVVVQGDGDARVSQALRDGLTA